MEPLRLGLIGLGVMGREHLRKEQGLAEVRFTAIADVVPEVVQRYSSEYNLPGFTSPEALIDSGLCEAVLIATPHPWHAPIAQYAARRGLHILCEKPIAVTVAQADAMIATAQEHGVLLGIMFQSRTHPLWRRARELLADGAIGPLYYVSHTAVHYRTQAYYDSAAWRGTWQGEGGGVIMNQAPHDLDLLIWLSGLPRRVVAQAQTRWHRIEVEDTLQALLEYEGRQRGYLYVTTAEWPPHNRYEFVGERGKLVVEDNRLLLFALDRPLPEEIMTAPHGQRPAGEWRDLTPDPAPWGHAEVVRQFARAIRLGEPLAATGEDGRRALELGNALLLAGFTGQPVAIPVDRSAYEAFLAERQAAGRHAT